MSTQTEPDLDDLDLLDDDKRHCRCTWCQPEVAPLDRFIALCGRTAISRGDERPRITPPADACRECAALFDAPCRLCGGL